MRQRAVLPDLTPIGAKRATPPPGECPVRAAVFGEQLTVRIETRPFCYVTFVQADFSIVLQPPVRFARPPRGLADQRNLVLTFDVHRLV